MNRVTQSLNDRTMSQTVRALLAIREWILAGELTPGERVSELVVVDRIGISRTPVRAALMRLEEEGLLEAIPSGGYTVKAFTEKEIFDAIEIRGTLEGLAARLAAERGVSSADLAPLRNCLADIDELLAYGSRDGERLTDYITLNARFHGLLLDRAGSSTLSRLMERATAIPFASPSGFVLAQSAMPESHLILVLGQEHHRAVVEAIEHREGTRAEAIMREHGRLASRNLRLVLENRTALDMLPGGSLIRRQADR